MRLLLAGFALVVSIALFPCSTASAQAPPASGTVVEPNFHCGSTISASDCDLVKDVGRRLLAVIKLEHGLHTWPPDFYVHDQFDENGEPLLNAFAHPCGGDIDEGMPTDCSAPEGSTKPHVHVTKRLLDELIQGRADRMAFVLGHEIGHITLGHTTDFAHRWKASSEVSLFAFGRQQEIGADLVGAEYGLAAGYPFEGMMSAIYRFIELDLSYSSLEGLDASHPSWEERLSFVDQGKITLWRALSTFRTGVSLLATEQYQMAEQCFRDVVQQFPGSHEAYANLGYAQLMQYIDQLEPADVERFGIGHIVVGAFTRRPTSLEPPARGIDAALWMRAVAALQQALRLKPDMIEAKANLGIAYMVAPQGPNVAEAQALFDQAVTAIPGSDLDNRTRAAIYINSGVANLAAGLLRETQEQLVSAERQINAFALAFRGRSDVAIYGELNAALQYNAGLLFSNATTAEGLGTAVDFFESYLVNTSPSSNWWPVAYARYTRLSGQIGREARTVSSFQSEHQRDFRTLGGIRLANGVTVTLGEPTVQVLEKMAAAGSGEESVLAIPLIDKTNLTDYDYYRNGVKITATQEVLAITLSSPAAPEIVVRESGLGTSSYTLRVGMTTAELESVVGSEFERRILIDPEKGYRFYRDLGLAVHLEQGLVSEFVITQIPYQTLIEGNTE